MIEWLWLLGAILLWPVFGAAIARYFAVTPYANDPDPSDYLFATMFGAFAAVVWPISLVVLGVTQLVRHLTETGIHEDS